VYVGSPKAPTVGREVQPDNAMPYPLGCDAKRRA